MKTLRWEYGKILPYFQKRFQQFSATAAYDHPDKSLEVMEERVIWWEEEKEKE